MRFKGFTLIELLVIIALMAIMVSAGVIGVNAMRDSSRLAGSTRDVMALVRRARALALVRQRPIVLSYSNVRDEDGEHAKVEIVWDKPKPAEDENVYDLDGNLVYEAYRGEEGDEDFGVTMTEYFSDETIDADVISGIKLAFYDESERLVIPENESRKSKISIYSTVDSVSRTVESVKTNEEGSEGESSESASEEAQGPWKVCFAPNGTLDTPHRIVLYPVGSTPEDGMVVHVDRFGEPVCEAIK